jgi:hypothetical protein
MARKSILHSDIPIRGSETTQLDIVLGFKNWLIHKLIIVSPFLITLMLYLFYKFAYLIFLMANNKSINNFNFIDINFLTVISVGLILSLTIGINLGNKWNKKIKEADELITSDEYIRGSKFVCVEEFNQQFKNEKDLLEFKIQTEQCERKF